MPTNYPNGVKSYGVPIMGGASIPSTTGQYIFVSSTTGSNGNVGRTNGLPLATIAQAVLTANAGKGDVIVVMPGHTETITAAAGIAINKSGIYIVGVGTGATRPTITFGTATTATMTITAADVTIDNLLFTQSFDAIVSPIVISASGVTIKNCYFMTGNASFQATQMILTTAAANNLAILSNRFEGTIDAGTTAAITLVGGDNVNIVGNDFIGGYTLGVGGIQNITTATTNLVIRNNTIVNLTASATKAITLLSGATGIISDNRFGIGSGAAPITAAGAWWNANYSSAAVATNGTLV